MTTPELLYQATHHRRMPTGDERCFWCGARCGTEHRAKDHVSNSFVGFGEVACPASGYVCGGCVLATDESDRAFRPRQASWLLTMHSAQRLMWDGVGKLLDACLNPPEPPYSIVLSVSGQKHLLYRAPVNHSREVVTAQHELSAITFTPAALAERLALAKAIAAATGKPALVEPPRATMTTALYDYYADPEPYLRWLDVWEEPVSRLAAHFAPAKETAQNEYPRTRKDDSAPAAGKRHACRLPATVGGFDGPGLFGG